MFEIPVGNLLNSYPGDSQELEFNGEVYDGFYEDLIFKSPLYLKLKLVNLDDGIMVIFDIIETEVEYEGNKKKIKIEKIEREFKEKFDTANPDDIKYININKSIIDLKDVIREEILMQCF
ncbi:hypothetical protein KAZ01_01725 [Candidatus Gracilibacteria bacterium]|nr:hypothetical protein [Candidatus Gracilibacteria bacterium]